MANKFGWRKAVSKDAARRGVPIDLPPNGKKFNGKRKSRRKRKRWAKKQPSPNAVIHLCPGCLEICTIIKPYGRKPYFNCPICGREVPRPIETLARNYRSMNVRKVPRLDIPLPASRPEAAGCGHTPASTSDEAVGSDGPTAAQPNRHQSPGAK